AQTTYILLKRLRYLMLRIQIGRRYPQRSICSTASSAYTTSQQSKRDDAYPYPPARLALVPGYYYRGVSRYLAYGSQTSTPEKPHAKIASDIVIGSRSPNAKPPAKKIPTLTQPTRLQESHRLRRTCSSSSSSLVADALLLIDEQEKPKRAEDAKPVVEKAGAGAKAALGPGALLPKGGWRRGGTAASGVFKPFAHIEGLEAGAENEGQGGASALDESEKRCMEPRKQRGSGRSWSRGLVQALPGAKAELKERHRLEHSDAPVVEETPQLTDGGDGGRGVVNAAGARWSRRRAGKTGDGHGVVKAEGERWSRRGVDKKLEGKRPTLEDDANGIVQVEELVGREAELMSPRQELCRHRRISIVVTVLSKP
ncbi:hypothetical protein LTS18_014311, partial [Coniosporium uncinatum]